MGWTSYNATHYKNGKIDRIAEVEEQLKCGADLPFTCRILKSSLVGSVVYSAVERINKTDGKREVFATIFLTSVNSKDYFNFFYKDMDETEGPCQCDCPRSILDLLTPTNSEYANNWRKACYVQVENRRKNGKDFNLLHNLPIGSKIKLIHGNKAGTVLEKSECWGHKHPIWVDWKVPIKFPQTHIKNYGYEVIKNQDSFLTKSMIK